METSIFFPFLGPKKCSLSPVVPVPTKLAALALMVLQVEHPRSVAVFMDRNGRFHQFWRGFMKTIHTYICKYIYIYICACMYKYIYICMYVWGTMGHHLVWISDDFVADFVAVSPHFYMTQTSRGGAPLLGRFPVADPAAVAGRQRCHCLGRRSRAKGGEGRSQRGSADDFMVILWAFTVIFLYLMVIL